VKWKTYDEIQLAKGLMSTDPGLYAGWVESTKKRKRWGDVDRDEISAFIQDNPPAVTWTPAVFQDQLDRQRGYRTGDEARRQGEHEARVANGTVGHPYSRQ